MEVTNEVVKIVEMICITIMFVASVYMVYRR